jgi:alcohol dehydrogenase class IV
MNFEFATAGRLVFGAGAVKEAGPLAKSFGRRALLVTGSNPARASRLIEILHLSGVASVCMGVAGEPDISVVEEGVELGKREGCDLVMGFGGGSALDAGKAVAAMLANPGELLDHLEVIGRGTPLAAPPVPFLAIPTTAGTGAEVTRNAVLTSKAHRAKVSLRSPLMLPRVALVDPELAINLPRGLTASTGLDALTQLIEPYLSCRANPMTDALCIEGIPRVVRSLRRACEDGGDLAAREDMSLASLWGGMALANAGLGAVHGLAGPIGGLVPAPHGAVCAALLPHVMAANLDALRRRSVGGETLRRFETIARLLTGSATADADDGCRWLSQLVREFRIPSLGSYGVTTADEDEIVARAGQTSSMRGNPVLLEPNELKQILRAAL